MIVAENWRLGIVKSPAAMLQEKQTRTPHMLRIAGGATRTCIPQVGFFLRLICRVYEKVENTARHSSSTARKMYIGTETLDKKNKIPVPLLTKCSPWLEHLAPVKTKKPNIRDSFPASYPAHRPRDYLATDSVQVKLFSFSATFIPVARLA